MDDAPGRLSAQQWRRQLERQERWTRGLRSHLYRRVNLWAQQRVLEVGCGDGVVTAEAASRCRGRVIGLDRSRRLAAQARARGLPVVVGDAQRLPFADEAFDLVMCHMTLLWVEEPGLAVLEMARVTVPGGTVVALAEPDYGGRIDYPEDLTVGALAAQALRREGAHPRIGRRLREMFVNAGFAVEVGILNSIWGEPELRREFTDEWELLESTAGDLVALGELEAMKRRELQALDDGIRTVFMPVLWAIGRKGG
ncbi:MAG TPA: methyltransferase domain-containing protein [Armatimonadota bacterium]|nr:methyltransferase domain-containing protein [Armatimonadota bacterium]